MRKQYHLWPAASGSGLFDAWDVDRLIDLSRSLPVMRVRVDSFRELDTPHWSDGTGTTRTVRHIIEHTRLILAADPAYPIILAFDGRVMDGMHRIARAVLEDRIDVYARQFGTPLEPDYRDCRAADLPYDRPSGG